MDNREFKIQNSKLKTIFWDFDGVIFNGMKIKADGFKELFSGSSKEQIEKFLEFHYNGGGVPRFDKIRYFYNNILNREISHDMVNHLAKRFSDIIKKNLFKRDNLILDSVTFIEKNYKRFYFHIVSGAEHNELNAICKEFNLDKFFITINGSPTRKDILIKTILEQYNYKKDESILIGDSITDYYASAKNGIEFYGYNNQELKRFKYIESFKKFNI